MSDWQEFVDDNTGTKYYFNIKTKESSWSKPEEMTRQLAGATPEAGQITTPAVQETPIATTPVQETTQQQPVQKQQTPPNTSTMTDAEWQEFCDNSGKKYFYNRRTRKSQWEMPDGVKDMVANFLQEEDAKKKEADDAELMRQQEEAAAARKRGQTVMQLVKMKAQTQQQEQQAATVPTESPNDWQEFKDAKSGLTYYFNSKTNDTQWEKPAILHQSMHHKSMSSPNLMDTLAQATMSTPDAGKKDNAPASVTPAPASTTTTSSPVQDPSHKRKTLSFSTATLDEKKDNAAAEKLTFALPKLADEKKSLAAYADANLQPIKGTRCKKIFLIFLGGLFSKTIKGAQLLIFQSSKLAQPLHAIKADYVDKINQVFDMIQGFCGDKKATQTPFALAKDLLQITLLYPMLRNEICCLLVKQTNQNPKLESQVKAMQLLALIIGAFPPLVLDLQMGILHYLQQMQVSKLDAKVLAFAKLAEQKLRTSVVTGGRKTIPSDKEIQSCDNPTLALPIFGVSLDEYMKWQAENLPSVDQSIPYILVVLAQGLEELGAFETEGIFRKPGGSREVEKIKEKFSAGTISLSPSDTKEPNVLASIFKLWLRELSEPLIPTSLYDSCLLVATKSDECIELVNSKLPPVNKQTLHFVIKFMVRMSAHQYAVKTMMTLDNLAMVIAPNILKNPYTDPMSVMKNQPLENMFMRNVMQSFAPNKQQE